MSPSHQEILTFIQLSKRANNRLIERIFTRGGCYSYHLLLKNRFPEAIPYKTGLYKHAVEHVISKINDRYYDITGEFHLETSEYLHISTLTPEEVRIAATFNY